MKRAFTLVELLIVIGIIVLVLGLAVPSFQFLTGSRSDAAAVNRIQAIIARARMESMAGINDYTGVMFYQDDSELTHAVLVRSITDDSLPSDPNDRTVWVDLLSYRDATTEDVTVGNIGVQFVGDCRINGANRLDDGYIGFNAANSVASAPLKIKYGAVILFDRTGKTANVNVAFAARVLTSPPATYRYTKLGVLLYAPNDQTVPLIAGDPQKNVIPVPAATAEWNKYRSVVGLVHFDSEAFKSAGFSQADPQFTNSSYGPEAAEEKWLDANASPILIGRYTGALVKGD